MEDNENDRHEVENVKIENKIREVCNLLTNFKPTEEMTDFLISELLRLEDACKQMKGRLTDY